MEVGSDKNILSILMIKFPEYDYCIRVGKRISLVLENTKIHGQSGIMIYSIYS